MIYTGSDEIRNIYLGNEEISAIYCGEDLIYPMSVTAWSVDPLTISAAESGTTQKIKIAAMDDWTITSSESWVTFSVTGGTSGRSRVEATIAANAGPQRTATITVADTGTTTALTISVTQEATPFGFVPDSITIQKTGTTSPGIHFVVSSPYAYSTVSDFPVGTLSLTTGSNWGQPGYSEGWIEAVPLTGDTPISGYVDISISVDSSATLNVEQVTCQPIICANNLDNYNNAGYSFGTNFYLFDTGLTEVNSCTFDFTGIRSICCRNDAFYDEVPVAALGNGNVGTQSEGCLSTLESFEADCSTVEVLNYSFGADNFNANNLTSITLTNTDNVTEIGNFVYWCENLQSIKLGDLSNAVPHSFGRIFGLYNTALTDFEVDALPDLDIDSSNWGLNGCTALTVTSLVNILNALPQTSNNRTITLGQTNINKLSAAQLAIATNKGWSVN